MFSRQLIQRPTNWSGLIIKVLALVVLVLVTNFGFFDRLTLLYASARWFTLVFYLGMWGVSVTALIIAALQPKSIVRMAWAGLLSFSAAAAFMYTNVSGSDLSVFDALSLWTAKHEAHRAIEFYQSSLFGAIAVFLCSFAIISIPVTLNNKWIRFGLKWFSWTPAVPVLLISAIILLKEGGGSQAMPSQFQPLAVGIVTAIKTASQKTYTRKKVTMNASQPRPVKHLVMLIDESVRPDYLNWQPGNPYTPLLAENKTRLVNYGQAASGGNCSSYANAILRLGGTRDNLMKSIRTSPTIWQYAKRAGFRTVFIDGQSGLSKDPGLLQNFMTVNETRFIDRTVRFKGVHGSQLDFKLLEVIKQELASKEPVFIYANKNGAHFPYDEGYPKSQIVFGPTVAETGRDRMETRINSYLNVIRWSVDKFFAKLFGEVDLRDTAIIYTSDHGQAMSDFRLTHCSVSNPNSREALVPLFAITGNSALKSRFEVGAKLNLSRASHFSIRPTILELMGYKQQLIIQKYGPSMFVAGPDNPRFSSGDVFGVFRKKVRWTPIDLRKNYVEFSTPPQPLSVPVASVQD